MNYSEPPQYRAFVVHCWEVRTTTGDGKPVKRFSVEDPRTGEKHGFADVEVLLVYLRSVLASSQPAQPEA